MAVEQAARVRVGRRKEAVARVQLRPGTGEFRVNGKSLEEYFGRQTLRTMVRSPFQVVSAEGRFDVRVNVVGGGPSGQAGAVRHGIARALLDVDETLRSALRRAGFLTRDPRAKERKKYGRKRARKGHQYSKR